MVQTPLYPDYLPVRPEGPSKPISLALFEVEEPGSRANHDKPEILTHETQIKNVTPRIGTEIRGVQISKLSSEGLDQIALLAAERGVLIFVRAWCHAHGYIIFD